MSAHLYDYFRSSSCFRVRIALALKQVSYEKIPVSLLDLDNLKPEYKKINPQGLVPTWIDQHVSLTQSLCIIEYLDETYPTPYPLIPTEFKLKYKAKELAYLIACDMAPLLNNARIKRFFQEHHYPEEDFLAWYHHWLKQGFDAYEKHLENSTGHFSVGEEVSIADLCLIPQIFNAQRFEFNMDNYPNIMQVFERCMKIPAFIESKP
jgi:maleylacetoacetate isomerase